MELLVSVAAQNRHFAKKFRCVRPAFDSLFENFCGVKMVNPLHEAILIGLTDSKPEDYFEVVPNREGFFQVLAGVKGDVVEDELKKALFSIISRSVSAFPFSQPDREQFSALLSEWGK